jgi:hypothetical protein
MAGKPSVEKKATTIGLLGAIIYINHVADFNSDLKFSRGFVH